MEQKKAEEKEGGWAEGGITQPKDSQLSQWKGKRALWDLKRREEKGGL